MLGGENIFVEFFYCNVLSYHGRFRELILFLF